MNFREQERTKEQNFRDLQLQRNRFGKVQHRPLKDVGHIDTFSRKLIPEKFRKRTKLQLKTYRKLPRAAGITYSLPLEFDWRKKTDSRGLPFLGSVKDQGSCGGCYAFTTATMLSHRFAIATDGESKPSLSSQDMITCGKKFIESSFGNPEYNPTLNQLLNDGIIVKADWYALEGCEGGLLVSSLDYATLFGLPEEKDVPYKSGATGKPGNVDYCLERNKFKRYYGMRSHSLTESVEDDLPPYDVPIDPNTLKQNVENMQLAIMHHGPIIATMNIYSDFMFYPFLGEVYQKKDSLLANGKIQTVTYEGGHVAVIVGWSETKDESGNTIPYWICENSWGEKFGNEGYFYIERGKNMANIEFDAYGLDPNLSGVPVASAPVIVFNTSTFDWVWILVIVIAILVVIAIIIVVVIFATKK